MTAVNRWKGERKQKGTISILSFRTCSAGLVFTEKKVFIDCSLPLRTLNFHLFGQMTTIYENFTDRMQRFGVEFAFLINIFTDDNLAGDQ